jgi:YidC/Oxa1 family membrane protein insertase
MITHLAPLVAENSLFKSIGQIAHPVFVFFGWILAGIYAVIPNYAIAITGLTVIIMACLTPLTVKSTKSMIAMQRLQPEMKKLQQKYKGPENREQLNQEMMKLYKESGTSPFGACLPSFLQMPFLFILYNLIKGLSNTIVVHGHTIAQPRYIPQSSEMYHNLVRTKGQMYAFGMNFSAKPFGHHAYWYDAIPYVMFIVVAVFLQYYQMKQMNSRNPQAAAANPQMQTMQKIFPLVFAVIYIRVPVGVTLYMVVSSAIRILTQEIMFRTGYVTPVVHEREISASSKVVKKGDDKPSNGSKAAAIEASSASLTETNGKDNPSKGSKAKRVPPTPSTDQPTLTKRPTKASNGNGANNGTNGSKSQSSANGAGDDSASETKAQNRSKSKRERKAR